MSRKNFVLETLLDKGEVVWKPKGNSMTPKIHSGDQVKIKVFCTYAYQVDDIVYAKVSGNHYLHLLTAIDTSRGEGDLARFQISNNHGRINGWTDAKNMFGICIQVKDKVLLSEENYHQSLLEAREKISLLR
jgi:hypothetical protein